MIVPAHTFIASALAVVHAGARPILCDVEAGSGLMIDPRAAQAMVGPRTAAVIGVHLDMRCPGVCWSADGTG